MKLKILGTRGEVKESDQNHSRHSGVLVDGEILLDLGEVKFLSYGPKAIFITHLHPDHAIFIVKPLKTDIPIYGPESYEDGVKVKVLSKEIALNSYEITPVPTHHSKKVKSSAYIVRNGGQKLIYTGDIVWIDRKYHHLLEGTSLVITDASIMRKGGRVVRDSETGQIYGHNGIPDLINLFKKFTRNIMFIHFGGWFYEDVQGAVDKLKALGKANGVNVIAGRDGMELDLQTLSQKSTAEAGLESWIEDFKDRRPL